jgi:hypothetical protein
LTKCAGSLRGRLRQLCTTWPLHRGCILSDVPAWCHATQVCSNLAIRASGGSGSSSSGDAKDLSASLGRLVSSVILLRDVLRCLPAMADSMAWVDSQLLRVRSARCVCWGAVVCSCFLLRVVFRAAAYLTPHTSSPPLAGHPRQLCPQGAAAAVGLRGGRAGRRRTGVCDTGVGGCS